MMKAATLAFALQFVFVSQGFATDKDPCSPCDYSNPNYACQQQINNGKNCTVCWPKDGAPANCTACSPNCSLEK